MVKQRVELAAGPLRVTLLPELGGSIATFQWSDGEHSLPVMRGRAEPSTPLEAACFPLVPYCNRIRGGRFGFGRREVAIAPNMAGDPSPLHGQGWLSPWSLMASARDAAEMRFSHDPGEWPWRYEARQTFELDAAGLSVLLACRNEDSEPMPCGLGLHPYFPCSADTTLSTVVEHVWTVDEHILPVGRQPATGPYDISGGRACGRGLDNGFGAWSGEAVIETPGQPFRLRLSSAEARFFQFFSPMEGGFFVAEPVSHANAAMNAPESAWLSLGFRILAPGETTTLSMRLDVLCDQAGASDVNMARSP